MKINEEILFDSDAKKKKLVYDFMDNMCMFALDHPEKGNVISEKLDKLWDAVNKKNKNRDLATIYQSYISSVYSTITGVNLFMKKVGEGKAEIPKPVEKTINDEDIEFVYNFEDDKNDGDDVGIIVNPVGVDIVKGAKRKRGRPRKDDVNVVKQKAISEAREQALAV